MPGDDFNPTIVIIIELYSNSYFIVFAHGSEYTPA